MFLKMMCYKNTFCIIIFSLTLHGYMCDEDIRIENNFLILKGSSPSFHQQIDISLFNKSDLSFCNSSNSYYCIKWNDYAQFNISMQAPCTDYEYKSSTKNILAVKFVLENVHLYGGAERSTQIWPIESSTYSNSPFVSSKVESQAVLAPLWIFSDGIYLYVDQVTPLFTSINKSAHTFSITAKNTDPYIIKNETVLKYKICKLPDVKAAYLHAVNNIIQRPKASLDFETLQKPIWSTWAKFKANISEKVVANFINEIFIHKFPISHIEIDDKWETCYGSLTIDPARFPDMKKFVTNLKKQNVKVTLWVHPFINVECKTLHEEAEKNDYFVKNDAGSSTKWWNGKGGYLDFTNPHAYEWYRKRLEILKNSTGIDAFKFDAGESDWAPDSPIFAHPDINYPDSSLKYYVKLASSFGNMVEVRVAKGTQQYPIFVRMMDRQSSWDQNLGIKSLIPTLLQMNVIGYPFVLPDMIGGNEYDGQIPDEELFIRWLQVNVFMPTMQLSIPPWDYSSNASTIALKMLKIHNSFSNYIQYSVKQFIKNGTPVNPPLWWIDPNDTTTYTIDSQFMLGEKIIVAPVLTKNTKSRDIYLPKGIWIDGNNKKGKKINGPKWLRSYKADLDTLPYFIKLSSSSISGGMISTSTSIGVILFSILLYYL